MGQISRSASSDELNQSISSLTVAIGAFVRHKKPAKQPAFSEVALKKSFRADIAASIINAADPIYPGICDVLFLGFCGWVVSPNDRELQHALMTHGVLDYFIEVEADAGLGENFDLAADMIARYVMIGPDFLNDVYQALGGHYAFNHAILRPILGDWLYGDQRAIQTFVKACEVFHFAVDNLNDRKIYRKLSITAVVEVLSRYRDDRLVERTVFYEKWAEKKSTIALLYTASTIRLGDTTMLGSILAGDILARDFISQFGTWLARARYFCDHVLTELKLGALAKENLKPLKTVKPEPFECAISDLKEIEFLKKKISK